MRKETNMPIRTTRDRLHSATRCLGVIGIIFILVASILPVAGVALTDSLQDDQTFLSDSETLTDEATDAAETWTEELDDQAETEILQGRSLRFEENQGQFPGHVRYKIHGAGMHAFLTDTGLAIVLSEAIEDSGLESERDDLMEPLGGPMRDLFDEELIEPVPRNEWAVFLEFQDANPDPQMEGLDEQEGISNYFIGNDPDEWVTDVPYFERVLIHDVWPGIDVEWQAHDERLKFDVLVHPGADPHQVIFNAEGTTDVFIEDSGRLVMMTPLGPLVKDAPYAYQKSANGGEVVVESRYSIDGRNNVGFDFSDYDSSETLIIDPYVYSTYLQGSNFQSVFSPITRGQSITVDTQGHAYITGGTTAEAFPTTSGAFQQDNPSELCDQFFQTLCRSVFVTKFSPSGDSLVYSTYIGGSDSDYGRYIAIDGQGNAFITGFTDSTDFPVSANAPQSTYPGGTSSSFLTKLSGSGSSLEYSTYLGGSAREGTWSVALDGTGSAYVAGATTSQDFPTTSGSYQPQPPSSGGWSGFVTKYTPGGDGFDYSTYVHRVPVPGQCCARVENVHAIDVDDAGSAYIAGGGFGLIVAKLSASGSSLEYGNKFGTDPPEVWDLALDPDRNAYVVGSTPSSEFPTTPGSFQSTYPGGDTSVFIVKISPTGDTSYSTFLGGSDWDEGGAIAIDNDKNAYVFGVTASTDFPIVDGAQQPGYPGGPESAFVTKLSASGDDLVYSTYLGGDGSDGDGGIAVDDDGHAYVAGSTTSDDFPTTPDAYQTSSVGTTAFVTKFPWDMVPPKVFGAPKFWSWGSSIPDLSGVSWQDSESGLNNNARYSVGTSSGATNVVGWTSMPAQPVSGQTSLWEPTWSPSALAEGTNYVNVRVENEGGYGFMTDGAYVVEHDATPPSVSGAPKEWAWAGSIPDLSGVSFQDGGTGLQNNVQYSIGTANGNTDVVGWTAMPVQPSSGQTTSWGPTWSPSTLAEGTNYVNVRVEDVGGNLRQANGVYRVQYDTVSPSVSDAPQTWSWRNTIPTLDGVAWQDALSGLQNNAQYSIGTNSGGTNVVGWTTMPTQPSSGETSLWDPSWSPSSLTQGTNYVNVRVEDKVGNMRQTNGAYIVEYETTAPTVSGAPQSWSWRNTIPTLLGVAWQDSVSGLQNNVQYSIGTSSGSTDAVGWTTMPTQPSSGRTSSWNPSWSPSTLTEGTNYINIRVQDVAENMRQTNGAYVVQYDVTLPSLPSIDPMTHEVQDLFYSATTFEVEWSATDQPSGIDDYRYQLRTSSCPSSLTSGTVTTGTSQTFSGLGPFEMHWFCAQARDNAGNWGPVGSHAFGVDTIPPELESFSPLDEQVLDPFEDDPRHHVHVGYNDKNNGLDPAPSQTAVDVDSVELIIDGEDVIQTWGPICAPNGPVQDCRVEVTPLFVLYEPFFPWEAGEHDLFIQIQDTVVDANTASESWSFEVLGEASDDPDELICGRPVVRDLLNNVLDGLAGECEGADQYNPPAPPDVDWDADCSQGPDGTVTCWAWAEVDEDRPLDEQFSLGPCDPGEIGIVVDGEPVCEPIPGVDWDADCTPDLSGTEGSVTCWAWVEIDEDRPVDREHTIGTCGEEETGLVIDGDRFCEPEPVVDWDAGCDPAVPDPENTVTCWAWVEVDGNRLVDLEHTIGPCGPDEVGIVIDGDPTCQSVPEPGTCDEGEAGIVVGDDRHCEQVPEVAWDADCEPGAPTYGETWVTCWAWVEVDGDRPVDRTHSVGLCETGEVGVVIDGIPACQGVDQDDDGAPDAVEPWLCTLQDDNTDLDGSCEDMSDYDPPLWWPNLWELL